MMVGSMRPATAASTVPLSATSDYGGSDRRQVFAAFQELMEDVVIGGMSNQGIDGYGFGERGKIAHEVCSPGRHQVSMASLTRSFSPGSRLPTCAGDHSSGSHPSW